MDRLRLFYLLTREPVVRCCQGAGQGALRGY